MFDKFGEFDSYEEINRAAAAQKKEGDEEALVALAQENGLDKEDAEDYMDNVIEQLATPLQAALGKLRAEEQELKLAGVLTDWKDTIAELCMEDEELQMAVRKKGKYLVNCMAAMLKFSFENKVQVSDAVVKATKVVHNGKTEPMRGPLYLGMPNKLQVRQIIREYYLGGAK